MNPTYFITQPELARALGIRNQAIAMKAGRLALDGFRIGNRTAYSPSAVRRFFEDRGFIYPKQVISFQMLKGGSTKTSSAFNLAIRLNQYGAHVLVIDSDSQANLTSALGHQITGEDIVLFHVLTGEASLQEAIKPVNEGLDLIPSDYDNSGIDLFLQSHRANLKKFMREKLSPALQKYDFVIFDCNPALSSLNISIALASDTVIIPVNPDPFSRMGLEKVLEEFERTGKDYDQPINFKLLYTLHDAREAASRKYLIEFGGRFEERMFSTIIKRNTDVKTAIEKKRPIFDFRKAPARADFDSFALEVLGLFKPKTEPGNA
jgi:chromosome partitioning protein